MVAQKLDRPGFRDLYGAPRAVERGKVIRFPSGASRIAKHQPAPFVIAEPISSASSAGIWDVTFRGPRYATIGDDSQRNDFQAGADKSVFRVATTRDLLEIARLGLLEDVVESLRLLELPDDWDGEGSPGYAIGTWDRAIAFFIRIATGLHDERGMPISSFEVMPGSYGNVDIELHASDRRLLFSVPADADAPTRYYGHDESGRISTKGTLDTNSPIAWLLQWFAE